MQTLNAVSAEATDITFVPHLLPMFRGIHVTLYARLRESVADLQALCRDRYAGHPFVRIEDPKSHPDTRAVYGTNLCRISAHRVSENQLVVLSVIDNLTKGAAGQALQNANLMFGFPETLGLTAPPMAP